MVYYEVALVTRFVCARQRNPGFPGLKRGDTFGQCLDMAYLLACPLVEGAPCHDLAHVSLENQHYGLLSYYRMVWRCDTSGRCRQV